METTVSSWTLYMETSVLRYSGSSLSGLSNRKPLYYDTVEPLYLDFLETSVLRYSGTSIMDILYNETSVL